MIYLINISLILIGFLIIYLMVNRKINSSINPRALIEEIREEVDKIILQLNNTTERNISLLEDKITELSDLLDKADKKIILLQRESEKYSVSKGYSHLVIQGKQEPKQEEKKVREPVKEIKEEKSTKETVLKLYREGFSASVIASHLNLPVGEVELIISLEKR